MPEPQDPNVFDVWRNPDPNWVTPDQYWAAQPPEVQALQELHNDACLAQAKILAGEGFTIDVPIMCWKFTPAEVMMARATAGMSTAPDGTGTKQIPVSIWGKDYPPFTPPAPPPPPKGTNLVGNHQPQMAYLGIGDLYSLGPGARPLHNSVGDQIEEDGHKFTLITVGTLMGLTYYWRLDS